MNLGFNGKNRKINKINPRKDRKYSLLEQKELVKTKLKKVVVYDENYINDLFSLLKTPTTLREIMIRTKNIGKSRAILRKLQQENFIFKIKFFLGGQGVKHKYKATDLFGELALKTFYFRSDTIEDSAIFILEKIPIHNNLGERRSLSYHLRRILPKEMFRIIHPILNAFWATIPLIGIKHT